MKRSTLCGGLAELWRCRKGTVAIEFALVATPLFLIIGAILEIGIFLFIQFAVQTATDRAARLIRLNTVGPVSATALTNQMSLEDFKAAVCTNLPLAGCAGNIHVAILNRPNLFANIVMPAVTSVGPDSETFQPGRPGDRGVLIVTYDWSFFFPFMQDFFGNVPANPAIRRLHGVAVYRNEE